MAQVILTSVGSAVGGPIGAAIGSALGAAADRSLIASLAPARQGPRLDGLQLQSSAEGAPMAAVFGRARIAGEIIWAARFSERRTVSRSGGGKGGPKSVDYDYALSFAVALCEGPIDGVGRVWADGQPMDMTGVVMRVHPGTEDQSPDALIEAVEGSAPAYRGTAYVVFEDLPLSPYGNRPPQLSFEVFRRPAGEGALEDALKAVCMIPGAGEFVYATQGVQRRLSITRTASENVNNTDGRPDIVVALDQLQAQLPNVEQVSLVVAWFGDDLRCGECAIRPGVELEAKFTLPFEWRAGGVDRGDAHLVSTVDGGPAYGGTPSDNTVVQAIAELKRRGLKVCLYPFVMMDVSAGSGLADPYGGAEQAAYPWRGRITCHPAAGQAGSPDKTSAAVDQVAAFFGTAAPGDFSVDDGAVAYDGPDEWSFRRLILHYARLADLAGGVDSFLIGSEMVGLTRVRSGASVYPAVAALRDLAGDCRAILGVHTSIGYGADWSEYFGHHPQDGSGDLHFHLDPLWADDDIDFVGIDWYPPITDWRDGGDQLDALAGFAGPHDPAYLAAGIAGGPDFDWYYASDANRAAQVRTPITDGAYGEPWVWRAKDLVSWWSNAHHDRPAGVRSASATAWVPQGKPIRLTEFGCPAVDKGANSPNLFVDPKSAESALPPFSSGSRDDMGQRRTLEAILAHFADETANPVSTVYGGPMIPDGQLSAWCWDARPFPDFPARSATWGDASNWRLGHWLNGRAGIAPLGDLLTALTARAEVEVDGAGAAALVTGYVIDRPMRLRDAFAPLAAAFAFDAAERDGLPVFVGRDAPVAATLGVDDLALPDGKPAALRVSRTLQPPPDEVRVRFIDEGADYQTGSAGARLADAGGGGADLDLPIVMDRATAEAAAWRALRTPRAEADAAVVNVSPLTALTLEAGDVIAAEGLEGLWRVTRVDADENPRLTLARAEAPDAALPAEPAWTPAPAIAPVAPPVLLMLDLPPLNGFEDDARPIAAVAGEPWRAMDVWAGPTLSSLAVRARASEPATMGQTLSALPRGPLWRWDRNTVLSVQMEGEALQSRTEAEVLAGLNALAVQTAPGGDWEIVQFANAVQTGEDTYQLTQLLRGQCGSDAAMTGGVASGAAVVLLTPDLTRAAVAMAERGLELTWRAAPAGGPASGAAMSETIFAWTGLAWRPFAPAHLKARMGEDGLALSWIRRARIGGDGWDAEPPLSEERETYLVEVLDGDAVVRAVETASPAWLYTPEMQAADFPSGAPNPLDVRVRQGSAIYGWGAAARDLLIY